MRALKGLLIYVGLVLAIAVGIAILLFSGMYFFPSFRIMSIGVVHGNRTATESVVLSDYSGFDEVELTINSKHIEINVEPVVMNNPEIVCSLNLSVFGLAYDITEYGILKQTPEVVDNVLRVTFVVTEPNGLISYTGDNLIVKVPNNIKTTLNISTTSGDAYVKSEDNSSFNLSKLNVNTNSGDFYLKSIYSNALEKSFTLDSLTLKTNSGTFDFKDINNLIVKNSVYVTGNDAKLFFKTISASLNIVGEGISLEGNQITTGVEGMEFYSSTGNLNVSKLVTGLGTENAIVTEHCGIQIGEVIGNTGIMSTYGNINIGTVKDRTVIKSIHGNVYIKLAEDDVNILTEYGNITVDNYKRNGIFTSKRGNINVKNTGEYEDRVYTKIVNEDGEINVDNNINKLLLETTGKSKATIIFRQIKGGLEDPTLVFEHRVSINTNGSAAVYMPTNNYNTPYMFKAYGNISGEISGLNDAYEGGKVKSSEDYQYFPIASEQNKEECLKSCIFEFFGTIEFKGYQNI